MGYFNDPRNYEALRRARPETPPESYHGNEVPQFYPAAVRAVFGAEAEFLWGLGALPAFLQAGRAVQLCLAQPGHYIAAVAYDDAAGEVVYNDPWPERHADRDGFNRRLGQAELKANVLPYMIAYKGSAKNGF